MPLRALPMAHNEMDILMQPYWPAWTFIFGFLLVAVLIFFIRREYRRHPVATQEAGLVDSPPRTGAVLRAMVLASRTQRTPAHAKPRSPRRSTRMKIYLVTIADQAAINAIDAAIDNDDPLFIGDMTSHGPIAEIQEYVNVDSP